MDNKQRNLVFKQLQSVAIIFNAPVTAKVFNFYVEALSKYKFEDVIKAIQETSVKCRYFPKPVEIIELIEPPVKREDADHMAGQIISSIFKFGFYQSSDAKNFLGSEAWNAVNLAGGWATLCDTPQNNLGMLRAQLRDFCLASINSKKIQERAEKRIEYKTLSEKMKINFKGNENE